VYGHRLCRGLGEVCLRRLRRRTYAWLIVVWQASRTAHASLVLDALKRALHDRPPTRRKHAPAEAEDQYYAAADNIDISTACHNPTRLAGGTGAVQSWLGLFEQTRTIYKWDVYR
jgi:hypothetical protein